jgi:hypothetical protein
MHTLAELKSSVSVRLKTFRGAKKTSGDGDIGRYCWDLLGKTLEVAGTGSSGEKVQEALALWAEMKAENILPLGDDMSVEEVKASFISAYDLDLEAKPAKLARSIAENGTLVSELVEAEAALNLAARRYWELLAAECSEDFIKTFKAQLAGDTSLEFLPQFRLVLEVLKVYDETTVELEPSRHGSVAISEMRERLIVAHTAFNLQL